MTGIRLKAYSGVISLLGLILLALILMILYLKKKRALNKCLRKNSITQQEFETKVYDELPEEVKMPVKFSCHMERGDGSAQVESHSVTLSYYFVIEYYQNKYSSILDDKNFCLTFGHERCHVLHPGPRIKLWLFSKEESIRSVLNEVRADIEGRNAFSISCEEAYKIMIEKAKTIHETKDRRYIIKRCAHPDWSDRCIYVRDFKKYDKKLEERVKKDYCKKLHCSYKKVANLTLLDDNEIRQNRPRKNIDK